MAFTDWVFEKSSSGIITYVNILNPTIPNDSFGEGGSLQVDHLTGSDLFMNAYNDTYVRGIIKGRMRTLIQPVSISGAGSYLAGFLLMQNQDNLTGSDSAGTGEAYGVFYATDAAGANTRFIIQKYTSGLVSAFGGTSIYLGSNLGTVSPGTITAMEIEWDATSGTQVDFILRRVINDTDFDNMITETTVSDSSSPLVVTASEGLSTVSDVSSAVSWRFDETNIYSVL